MGLDTSHGCWHGSYGNFHHFRMALAKAADIPLGEMVGFTDGGDGRPWSSLPLDDLHILLNHSDCDGEIAAEHCYRLALRLQELKPKVAEEWRPYVEQFVTGLMLADARGEAVDFH